MTSRTLNSKQIDSIARMVTRQLAYLNRLTGRMHQAHFPYDDPLRIQADVAEREIEQLAKVLGELRTGIIQK